MISMRRLILLVLVTATAAFVAQRPDVRAIVDEAVTLTPKTATINAANTGLAVDIAAYSGAMLYMQTGVVDNVATVSYLTLQDSSVTPAQVWTVHDSILVDSVDNKLYEIGYRGTRRYLRAVQRATAAAADSLWQSAAILMTGRRAR